MAFDLEPDSKGLYGLCVFNADTLGDKELQEEFGKFGHIVHINRSNALVFIRFQEKEEAEHCLEAYRNHSKFKVNPARKKNPGNNDQRNHSSFNRSPREDIMNRSRGNNSPRFNQGGQEPVYKLIPINKDDEKETNEPPKLMAKAVIIANIPNNMLQGQVHDLCKRANVPPLQVDMFNFKKPGYRTINYATVYLKNQEDANNVVLGLGNLVLNGRQLLVNHLEHYQSIAK